MTAVACIAAVGIVKLNGSKGSVWVFASKASTQSNNVRQVEFRLGHLKARERYADRAQR